MMKKNLLLATLALPMVFAACSQDDLILDNAHANKGGDIKVSLNVTKEGDLSVGSRANWNGSGLTWEPADKISMYWLGSTCPTISTALNGKSNAVFKSDENGTNFSSESLVYLGSNAVVYPANTSHYADQKIVIEVPASQTAATVKNVPYISNELSIQEKNIAANTPGYHQPVFAPMKMAANVVTLKLDVKNTAALEKYGFNITSVELQAENAFAKQSNLVLNSDVVETKGEFKTQDLAQTPVNTIEHSTWTKPVSGQYTSTLTSEAITANADGTYDVRFVVLPTDVPTLADASIVVNTTCGTITLKTVTETIIEGGVSTTTIKEGGVVNANLTNDAEGYMVSIAEAIKFFATSITMPTDDAYSASAFQGEKVGRTIPRTVTVDASKAVLTGSKVYTSEDIIRYVNLYTDMKKTDAMELVMAVKDAEEAAAWNNLTKEAVDAVNAKNPATGTKKVTLSANETVNAIVLSTVGSVYDVPAYNGKALPLVLSAGAWTMNDTFNANDKFSKLQNNGTLTINGTTTNNGVQNKLAETVENNGILNIGGNNVLFVNGKFASTANSTINVAAGQIFTFAESIDNGLYGTYEVAGQLTSAAGEKVKINATVNNSGIVAAEGIVNGFYNFGTINMVADNAITYVQSNAHGVINLKNRNDEVQVYQADEQGKIVYNYNANVDGDTFYYYPADRFTYVKFNNIYKLAINKNDIYRNSDLWAKGDISKISMEFLGTTVLEPNAQKIADLTIAKDAHLQVLSTRLLNVKNLYLYGQLTIGGTIKYELRYVNEGRILNPGTGTITSSASTPNFDVEHGIIYNVAGLLEFAEKVNGGETFSGKTITLQADINLAGIEWTPIGNSAKPFKGTFNGLGHKIVNLNVEGTEQVGLFGYVIGEINNVVIEDADVLGYKSVAAVVGHIYGSVSNCTVKNSVVTAEIYDAELDGDNVGAIVGLAGEGTFALTNCTVNNTAIYSNPVKDAGVLAGSVFESGSTLSGNTMNGNTINGVASSKECVKK